jgi:hypothetical protein
VTQQIHIHLHRNGGAVDLNWDHVVDYLLLVVDADASITGAPAVRAITSASSFLVTNLYVKDNVFYTIFTRF